MKTIFLSYRRGDSADVTGRIDDRLVAEFGRDNVFKDVDSIPLGRDFRTHLGEAVGGCDVLLVVIGDGWLSARDADGSPRLEDPSDFVRIEVESALKRDIPVVPVLLGSAEMPRADQLPEALRELAFRNGTKVRPDPDFHLDMDRILKAIKQIGPPSSAAPQEAPAPAARIAAKCACGQTLWGATTMAGEQAACPACGAVVQFPGVEVEAGVARQVARTRSGDRTRQPRPRGGRRPVAVLLVSLLVLGGAGVLAWMNRNGQAPESTYTADAPSADTPISPNHTPSSPLPPEPVSPDDAAPHREPPLPVPPVTAQESVRLVVTSPLDDALLPSRTIQVRGTAEGPLPEGSLRIGATTAQVGRDGTFEATLEAPQDGPFSFEVRCTDTTVLSEPVARQVVVDTQPPRLELSLPEAGVETVSTPELVVQGRLLDDHTAELSVNGDAVALDDDGRFELSWKLTPDHALTLVFEAQDAAGHHMPRLERTFRYERTMVEVRLDAPATGALLAADVVEVRGRVEGGVGLRKVLVNGEEVTTRRDGTFTHALHPSGDGPLEVVVEVDDTVHRSEKVTRTVAIDRSPPRLEMTSPRTATTTARSHIVELSGRVTDPHLEGLYLDGKPVVVAEDGAFFWPVFAPAGAGASVSLEAADTLGNRTSRSYHVIGRANRASRGVMTFHDTWSDAQAAAQRSQRLVFACVSRYNPP